MKIKSHRFWEKVLTKRVKKVIVLLVRSAVMLKRITAFAHPRSLWSDAHARARSNSFLRRQFSGGIIMENKIDVQNVVTYEQFGAVGDGVADDSEAIRKAHNYANERGLKVLGTADAKYRIGSVESSILIMTETDWNGAEIIFDDTTVHWTSALRSVDVFNVVSESPAVNVEISDGMTLAKGQTNIGMTFEKACMLKLEDDNEKIYKRYGENANGGVAKNEMILVDEKGNVDPTTPIQYDYSVLTKITAYSIDDEPLEVGNARFTTLVLNPKLTEPDYENNYCYYQRGLLVTRSNTSVHHIVHRIYGEDMTIEIDRNGDGVIDKWGADKSYGVPYHGFFTFRHSNNVKLTDCHVQGHQAYCFFQGDTRNEKGSIRNEMGSYDINATDCINLSFLNIVQYENHETGEVITNRFMYHGIMGSNFCRNVVMDNCYVDRFDSHQGVHNARITNCTLGFGILVIGGGELYIENVHRISGGSFIHLRMDYNSVFDGDVVMKNCRMGQGMERVIEGLWIKHYNGLPNRVTNSLTIDGLVCEHPDAALYSIRNADKNALNDDVNKLILPKTVKIKNVFAADGTTPIKPRIAIESDAFEGVEYICE